MGSVVEFIIALMLAMVSTEDTYVFKYNPANEPFPGAERYVIEGAQEWNDRGPPVFLVWGGLTNEEADGCNKVDIRGYVVVSWTLADGSQSEAAGCFGGDVWLRNPPVSREWTPGSVREAARHEFGHVLGIRHHHSPWLCDRIRLSMCGADVPPHPIEIAYLWAFHEPSHSVAVGGVTKGD